MLQYDKNHPRISQSLGMSEEELNSLNKAIRDVHETLPPIYNTDDFFAPIIPLLDTPAKIFMGAMLLTRISETQDADIPYTPGLSTLSGSLGIHEDRFATIANQLADVMPDTPVYNADDVVPHAVTIPQSRAEAFIIGLLLGQTLHSATPMRNFMDGFAEGNAAKQ